MESKTFCYDLGQESWRESTIPAFASPELTDLPLIPIVDYSHERTGERWKRAWCEAHHAYEDIEGYTADGLTSKAGCRLEGIPVSLTNNVYQTYYSYDKPTASVGVRWQVRQRPGEDSIYLDKGTVTYMFTWEKDKQSGEFVPVPSLDRCNVNTDTVSLYGDAPKDCPEIPYPVLLYVLKLLQMQSEAIYGFTPKLLLPSQDSEDTTSGKRKIPTGLWLSAFLHRPLDMNIYFFRKYFYAYSKHEFDALFPCEAQDNFPTLAKAFGLPATDELRSLYEKNPLSLIFRMMLPELGVKREEFMAKFDHLLMFCGKTMAKTYGNRLFFDPLRGKKDKTSNKESRDYDNLRFYTNWLRQHISEEALTERLLAAQNKWHDCKFKAMEYFRRHFDQIPEDLTTEIIAEGLTFDVRDKLGILAQHLTSKETRRSYSDEVRSWECKINDYNFRLISSLAQFNTITHNLSISHYNHRNAEEMEKNDASFFVLERNGRYLASIWLKGKTVMGIGFNDFRNYILVAKFRVVYLYWLRYHGLEEQYFSRGCDAAVALDQKFTVEPVDTNEWEICSLKEMMEIPAESRTFGYYLSYCRKLAECSLMHAKAPTLHDDEQAYLEQHYAWGKPIFDAAFDGNAEAEYVMSLFYRGHIGSAYSDYRRSENWYKKAVAHGWLDISPAQKDVRIDYL